MSVITLGTQPAINALLYGTRWDGGADGTQVSFSFAGAGSTWADYAAPGEPYQGFAPLGAQLQQAVRNALAAWAAVANISFVEVVDDATGNGQIRSALTSWQMGGQQLAYAYLPNDVETGGDVWLNIALAGSTFMDVQAGTLAYYSIVHELGHALGLKHPGEISAYSSDTLSAQENTVFNSVMSTYAWPGKALDLGGSIDRLPSTPMSYDIDALQFVYGANAQTQPGDDDYVFDGDGRYLQTLYDTGGKDTITLTGARAGVIDLRPGAWSALGHAVEIDGGLILNPHTVQVFRTTVIENARGGAGADALTGNDHANWLLGNGGSDTLTGGAGNDTLDGGGGFDTAVFSGVRADYTITKGSTDVAVSGAEGTDLFISVEKLRFADQSILFRPATSDFDGHGRRHILCRDTGPGAATIWKGADGPSVQAVHTEPNQAWQVAGVGDFQGDGEADILWRNGSTGQTYLYNSGNFTTGGALGTVAELNWKIAGLGDFNGDGRSDILWRNTSTGANTIWRGAAVRRSRR